MTEVIPAIIPQSFEDLEDKMNLVARYTKLVQIDVLDGKFVPARSWPYQKDHGTFQAILNEDEGMPLWESLDFEVDLMVKNPEQVINDWITAGASRVIVHIESTDKMDEIVKIIHKRVELGIALDIDTSTDTILPYLEDVDFVQFMGIAKIGFQGEKFDERVVDKIREFHNAHPEVVISVDGGVTLDSAPLLVGAGVRRLVSGSTIYDSADIGGKIGELKHIS